MIVFTNGCFDIVHAAHVGLLEFCRELTNNGDEWLSRFDEYNCRVIVGLNGDESVRRLKGEGRPVNNQKNRKRVLEAIKYVNDVYIFDEDTPLRLITELKPDIIVKGGDYKAEDVVGAHLVKRVVIYPYEAGVSTTDIFSRSHEG